MKIITTLMNVHNDDSINTFCGNILDFILLTKIGTMNKLATMIISKKKKMLPFPHDSHDNIGDEFVDYVYNVGPINL